MDHSELTEKEIRQQLADCFQLLARFGWSDLIYTHVTARVPNEQAMLINPYGYLFDQISPEMLVKIDFEGNIIQKDCDDYYPIAGYIIHSAIHQARHDIQCIIHTHSETAMAISALKCGLLPITQNALRFYKRIAYHNYQGFIFDETEQPKLVEDLGQYHAMILRNHGFLTVGCSIPHAFSVMHFLEKAAAAQLKAMATNSKLIIPPARVCEKAASMFKNDCSAGDYEWLALVRSLRTKPSDS